MRARSKLLLPGRLAVTNQNPEPESGQNWKIYGQVVSITIVRGKTFLGRDDLSPTDYAYFYPMIETKYEGTLSGVTLERLKRDGKFVGRVI